MDKMTIKEQIKNIGFVLGSCAIITIVVFSTIIGCSAVEKGAAVVEKGAVETKADVKNNNVKVSPELIAAFKAEVNKIIAEKVENLSQTNNSGILSGGAPYLIAVVFALISLIEWILGRETNKKLYESKEQVKKQHELIKELAVKTKKEINEAEYKAKISAIRGKDG